MTKRPVILLTLAFTFLLSINGFAQTQGVARVGSGNGASAAESKKKVSAQDIESDIAEALSLVESNYVSGKKLNYNTVMKSSIDGMLLVSPGITEFPHPARVRRTDHLRQDR